MDYKNGRIYQIRNTVDDDVYVGSTCQALSKRMAKHRTDVNTKARLNILLYKKMRELGVDCFYIELLEECPCKNKEQLRKREGHFIREIGTLNMCQAGRTINDWREENKDKIKEYRSKWEEQHTDQRKESKAKYREKNKESTSVQCICPCGGHYRYANKSRHFKSKTHIDFMNSQ